MSQEDLRRATDELRDAINELDIDDQHKRAKLEKLIAQLDEREHEDHEEHGMRETADELAADLDARHPKLTRALNQVMVTLSNLGI